MSKILYSYFLKKAHLDTYLTVGENEDPYFEEIPKNELHFYQRPGARRKRKLPQFIPKHDLKILDSVKRKAYRLDLQLSMCGLRLGWAGIIGLIPWIGDVICLLFAMQLLHKADKIEGGLPPSLRSQMMLNIMFDFGIGLIPFVGDLVAIAYKCNSRNFILLEHHLVRKYDVENAHHAIPSEQGLAHEKPVAPPVSHPAQDVVTSGPVNAKPVEPATGPGPLPPR